MVPIIKRTRGRVYILSLLDRFRGCHSFMTIHVASCAREMRCQWFAGFRFFLFSAPLLLVTSGGYDLSKSVMGFVKLNTPADIPGGESLEVTLNWPTTVDLTGIEVNLKLLGTTYRQLAN